MSDLHKDIEELKLKVKELREFSSIYNIDLSDEIKKIEDKIKLKADTGKKASTSWNKVTIARMALRPTSFDYIEKIFEDFVELHGDRCFGDDSAVIGGIARLNGLPVTIIGQQKGRNTKENIVRNFGMLKPEGYRKALRLMKQAEKFNRPVICFVDTPGAFCGIEAEERGQGEAIAKNLMEMSTLKTQVISIVIGEGGSGGALGLAVSDRVYMLENSIYSIISPEGCASILLKDSTRAREASELLKLTAQDLKKLGIIDGIIGEPTGGAHNNPDLVADNMKKILTRDIQILKNKSIEELLKDRYEKFRRI